MGAPGRGGQKAQLNQGMAQTMFCGSQKAGLGPRTAIAFQLCHMDCGVMCHFERGSQQKAAVKHTPGSTLQKD